MVFLILLMLLLENLVDNLQMVEKTKFNNIKNT